MITIACCLWGDFPEAGWSREYVRRLYEGCKRNTSKPFEFVCFTNNAIAIDGVEIRPLAPRSWIGNLPKTFVYSPEAKLEGRVMLFDLDNVIVASIDEMLAYDGPLCVRGRLQYARSLRRQPDGDMIAFEAGSTLAALLWDSACDRALVEQTRGRERDFILAVAPRCDQWQNVCPGHVVSYKYDCRRGLPRNARVVTMHGKPRPHEVSDKFITEHWR